MKQIRFGTGGWKNIFGIDCAGCGATRMVMSILKFDFYQAFRYNPLIFIFIVFAIIYLIYVIICIVFKKKYFVFKSKYFVALVIFLVVFMILRNTEMFEFLKPTIIK